MNDLDEILDNYLMYTLKAGYWANKKMIKENKTKTKQAILDWHNKQVEEVLDRLEAQWGESIDQTMGEPVRFRFVHLSAIEAERNKLKEVEL